MHRSDLSYGIIPVRYVKKGWEVLLVQHGKGHWSFPKGHPDPGEAPQEAARRELEEETGLQVSRFFDLPELEERYQFRYQEDLVHKRVIYFLAEVSGEVKIQEEEITDFRWCHLEEAAERATFPASKELCRSVHSLLKDSLRSRRLPGKSSS